MNHQNFQKCLSLGIYKCSNAVYFTFASNKCKEETSNIIQYQAERLNPINIRERVLNQINIHLH